MHDFVVPELNLGARSVLSAGETAPGDFYPVSANEDRIHLHHRSGGSTVVQSIVTTDEVGQQTKVDLDYDAYGNVLSKREYDFKISGQWQVRRRTHYSNINFE